MAIRIFCSSISDLLWVYVFMTLNLVDIQRDQDQPRQGVVANTLKFFRQGGVGFIDWLDPLWPQDFISLSIFPRRTFSTRLFPPDESAMSTSSPASRT